MRLFVAVPFPTETKNKLVKLIDDWRKNGDKVGWVKKENLHLTLKFLGEASIDQLEPLKKRLAENLTGAVAFSLSLSGAGAFPNLNRPRVLWVGVTDGREKLAALAQNVEQAALLLGFAPEERGFSAHLTLGRVKDSRLSGGLLGQLRTCAFEAKNVIVSEVVLFQSELAPGGSIYTPLASFELKK